ncbi:GTP cyclohydrolase [Bacillus cereus]|uniref:GTP cyclohydrolase II n=1 Tax=Bacillus cereus TaxID=1396 RepID=A0A2A8PPE3_BACCE|nr:GTP cyclohydrolase II [Bacillus cereus]PEV95755.1 GTP cyclohydrolase [Bacillus cereus]
MNDFQEKLDKAIKEFIFKDKKYVFVGPVNLPINIEGQEHIFSWYGFSQVPVNVKLTVDWLVQFSEKHQTFSSCLLYGDFEGSDLPVVRIHSVCQTGDVFGSLKCDCGPQLKLSLKKIVEIGVGGLIYLTQQEGRGIGLLAKALAYKLQEDAVDTFEANRIIGCKEDVRNYEEAAAVLNFLRNQRPISLLTNNLDKIDSISHFGIPVERNDHTVPFSQHNYNYIIAKIESGQLINKEIIKSK